MKYRFRTKPFPYQRRATLKAVRLGSIFLFMDPGTGKTKVSLDAAGIMALQGRCSKVLVVTTLDGMGVWEEEIREHYPGPCTICIRGDRPSVVGARPGNPVGSDQIPPVTFYIINYEQYRQRTRHHKKWEYNGQAFERWLPDLIVYDESHRLKRAGGVTAQFAWRSVRRMRSHHVTNVHLLTGTPNPKGWIDVFAQARVLNPDLLGTSKSGFEEDHVVYGVGSRRFTILKYRNVRQLKKKIRRNAFIISKKKALPWLPEQTWQNVPFTLPRSAQSMYDEMAEELITSIGGEEISAKNIGARRIRLLQITGGFTTGGTVIHRERMAVARAIFEGLQDQEQHFVVFCRFIPEVEGCAETIAGLDIPVEAITGRVDRTARRAARRDFQRRRGPRALVFQVATGSEAITLTAASEVLFYSLPDGWLQYRQACDRVHRPGQAKPVRYRHLIARGTLDRSVLNTLVRRADQHAELMGDPGAFLRGVI
jgi:hypothetical protein